MDESFEYSRCIFGLSYVSRCCDVSILPVLKFLPTCCLSCGVSGTHLPNAHELRLRRDSLSPAQLNLFTPGNPFMGAKLLVLSIGRGLGAGSKGVTDGS